MVNSLYTSIVQNDGLKGVERVLHRNTELKTDWFYSWENLTPYRVTTFGIRRIVYVQTKRCGHGIQVYFQCRQPFYEHVGRRPYPCIFGRILVWVVHVCKYFMGWVSRILRLFLVRLITNMAFPLPVAGPPTDRLPTRTFFKPTNHNGYMPTSSCHHPKLKGNIPKGQLMKLRRNCCILRDFEMQADTMLKEIWGEGITKELGEIKKLRNMSRGCGQDGTVSGCFYRELRCTRFSDPDCGLVAAVFTPDAQGGARTGEAPNPAAAGFSLAASRLLCAARQQPFLRGPALLNEAGTPCSPQ